MNPEFESHRTDSQEKEDHTINEPRTIPRNWDVSAFHSSSTPGKNGKSPQPDETANQTDSENFVEPDSLWDPDPFPQPRTMPAKWDLSDLK